MSTIELIGCTGAGKSTLALQLLEASRERGIDAYLGDEFALRQARLGGIPHGLARQASTNMIALAAAVGNWPRNSDFYGFAFATMLRLQIAWTEKALILRNILKNSGIREIARRRDLPGQIVILDEGPVHSAHGLFVHDQAVLPDADVARFADVVPLPDVVVYLREKPDVLIGRALARGHRRIPRKSREAVERFIRRAVHVFDVLVAHPAIRSRALIVDRNDHLTLPQGDELSMKADAVSDILQTSLAIAEAHYRGGHVLHSRIGLAQ